VILMRDGRIVRDGSTRDIFRDESSLQDLGLTPPPAVQVANRLGVPALTLDELIGCLTKSTNPPIHQSTNPPVHESTPGQP